MQPTTTAVSSGQGLSGHGAMIAGAAPAVPGLVWAVPFLGLLLCFALLPMVAPRWWHRRQAWVAVGWSLALLLPRAVVVGPAVAAAAAWQEVLGSYLPFITLLLALYAAGGGVLVRGGDQEHADSGEA